MTTNQWIYLAIIFAAVVGVCLVMFFQLAPNRVKSRLEKFVQPEAKIETTAPSWVETAVRITGPLAKLSVPDEGWEQSPIRIRFMQAGYRGAAPIPLFFASKTILALALPAVLFLYMGLTGGTQYSNTFILMLMLLLAVLGYYLPNVFLARRTAARKLEIFENFPDAIDLMLVCVEAGLGLDAALTRVADEIQIKSKLLAEELHLVNLELRAGNSKEKALRNLAMRTGVVEIETLVSMLVQADRFGTSIGDSLRVHAEDLRTKRRLRAEETAAKIPVKLLFPLIFFIFPSLLLVLLGPAMLKIYRILLPAMAGSQ